VCAPARPTGALVLTCCAGARAHTGPDAAHAFLGYERKPFEFTDVETPVTFAEGSVHGTGADALAAVEAWLRTQYPL
jgi:hypothetical protein